MSAATYAGEPCSKGHTLRYVNGGMCAECNRRNARDAYRRKKGIDLGLPPIRIRKPKRLESVGELVAQMRRDPPPRNEEVIRQDLANQLREILERQSTKWGLRLR